MAGRIFFWALVGALGAMLIVPFVIGLVRGPEPGGARPHSSGEASMRPYSRVAGLYARFLALYGFVAVGSFAAGRRVSVCAATPFTATSTPAGYSARPGGAISALGTVQACAPHPSAGQWACYLLMRLPGPILLATVLLVSWQLIREARRNGPFTARTVDLMWRLGLVVLIGSAVAGAISRIGSDLLLRMLMVNPPFVGTGIATDALVSGSLRELLPVPLLVGAALLSFARITRLGAELDEEVRATV